MLILYIGIGSFLFIFQKNLIYHPNSQVFENCFWFEDYEKKNLNNTRFYYKKNYNEKILIYYYGNAGSACDRGILKNYFENNNFSIIFLEYTGYSNDKRKPSKKRILSNVKEINEFIKKNKYENIILYGESIGSGPASYHTTINENIKKIILVSPFSSLEDIVKQKFPIYPISILLKEKYENINWLENYEKEIIIIHGKKDNIIKKEHSKNLYENLNTEYKKYYLIENKGHNDLWNSNYFKKLISKYLK